MISLPNFPKTHNPYFVAFIATMGGMLFGFDISSMSAIIGTEQYRTFFNNPSGIDQGAIGSALAAGSVVGSIIAGPISDKIGRRDSVFFSCIFWIIGTAIQIAVNGQGMLIAGRLLNGITVGITSSQVPVYLAEIAKREKRGSLVIIQQLAIEWGVLIMYFIGYGCSFIDGPASFRTAWGMQLVPCVFLLIGLPFLPRSPRWLAKVDRMEEAVITLAKIQAGGDVNDPLVIAELNEIRTVLAAERAAGKGLAKWYKNDMWKRTLVGFWIQAWQQLAGANVMTYYIVYVFSMANLSGNINLVSSGVQYALFIVFTSIMFFFIDRLGRRTLLIYGVLGMGLCHFVIAGALGGNYEYIPEGVGGDKNVIMRVTGSPAYTVIAFSYLMIIIYAATLAPVCWIYAAEVWSLETRATGMGLAATGNWLFNFALGLFVPPAFRNIRYNIFIIFGVLCICAAIHFYVAFPETCGKTIEEVEFMFSKDGPRAWKTKKGESGLDEEIEKVIKAQQKGEPGLTFDAAEMGSSDPEKGVSAETREKV